MPSKAPAIAAVEIGGLRGILGRITLQLDGKSYAVHGDNGTGKSSMVRALAWALRNEDPPLPDHKSYSTAESFRTHVLAERHDPFVKITLTDGGTIQATCSQIVCTGSGAEYRTAALASNPILTRSKMLAVIENKPGERYRYLESFLDLERVDGIRTSLKAKSEQANSNAEKLRAQGKALVSRVLGPLGGVAETLDGARAALAEEGARIGLLPALAGWDEIYAASERAKNVVPSSQTEKERGELQAALAGLASTEQQPEGNIKLDDLAARRNELVAAVANAKFADLLGAAARHLEAAPVDTCPLCEQPVDHEKLTRSVLARLEQLRELREVTEKLRDGTQIYQTWWRAFLEGIIRFVAVLGIQRLTALEGVPEFPAAKLLYEKRTGAAETFGEALLAVGVAASLEWSAKVARALRTAAEGRLAKLPTGVPTAEYKRFSDAVDRASAAREELVRVEAEASQAAKQARTVEALADAVRLARQDVAQELLSTISDTVGNYYNRIHPRDETDHPAEVTSAPIIEVQRHKDGTAFVRGEFNKRKIEDPRWAYSDGHQDTIGLCLFLALRKYRSQAANDCRVMVLDDVILSIDLPHTKRVARLLAEEFKDHQILFFTHNNLVAHYWKEPIPTSQRIQISSWTLEGGPKIGQYVHARDRLASALATAQTSAEIGKEILPLVEEWSVHCRYEYAVAIPARRGERYTLGDIWPNLVSKLGRMEKRLGAPIRRLKECLEALKDLHLERNLALGHYNEPAQEMPLSVMRDLGKWTVELFDTLYCRECEEFAKPMPNEEKPVAVACRGSHLRYLAPAPPSAETLPL